MAAYIKQLLLIAAVAVLYTKAASQPMSLPNCTSKCGSVTIPYPFGTTKNCSLNNTFLIDCNQTSQVPFLPENKNIRVINISFDGELRVAWPIASDCYTKKGEIVSRTLHDINMTHFHISPTQNKLIGIGCDTSAVFAAVDSEGNGYLAGCVAYCNSRSDVTNNQPCTGIGCCEISIPQPKGRVFTEVEYVSSAILNNNHTAVHKFNPCGYAFLVESGSYSFSRRDLELKKKEFPVVLNWAVGKKTCQQAKMNHSSYACNVNSTCYDAGTGGVGYFCTCFHGYQGNPYLLQDGCQGYEGDGKSTGKGCSKKVSTKQRKEIILIIALSVSLSLVALPIGSFYAYFALKKRKLIKLKEQFFQQNGGLLLQQQIGRHGGSTDAAKIFTLEELKDATNNFNEGKILGQGGQGTVYKGILQDKRIVAIKKSKINDPDQIVPFINEVVILSQINHRNVVKLFGCCLETEVPLLVYEFISNGTVHEHLHDQNQSIKLTWKTRLRIAKETAGVLSYLHSAATTPVIHRDVKSTNILLDHNLTAKVSDFGASRIVPLDHSQINTLVQGTLGYLDPEYLLTSQLTEKSDVYSFGVVLAELLTGKKALSSDRSEVDRNLAAYFGSSMKQGRLLHILDKSIDEGNIDQLKEVAHIAERCLRVKGEDRPTMKEVAMELEGILVIEKHRWGSDNLFSEETENFLKTTQSVKNVEDGIGGSGIINSSDSYSLNQISLSIGGR
ncbi:hypothetical protein TSUD_402420 [Trifolium subterraneum]|uniref:Protein kinase domain-containing protein n=1 Tax=Trifolium subterraneum TaxID=3900 RepID=A0A2Z6PM39_TRISU|nr:hypothetical protein TSUD_402420 [Trifolium subterraneum]